MRAPALTRLNAHYSGALGLATLILQSTSVTTSRGEIEAAAFVFDMNKVFEDFLSTALRTALEHHGGIVELQNNQTYLDEDKNLVLKPDIIWRHQGRWRAVIDAKYKALASSIPNADAYQMLAYCTAFKLKQGHLVYAKEAGRDPVSHSIRNTDVTIHVRAIDLEQTPAQVLEQVGQLADEIAGAP